MTTIATTCWKEGGKEVGVFGEDKRYSVNVVGAAQNGYHRDGF